MRVADPPVPSRLMFWAFVGSTVGTFTGTALLCRIFDIPLEHEFSTRGLWNVVAAELALGVLWVVILRRHGWTRACITLPLSAWDLMRGVGLLVLSSIAYSAATSTWALIFRGAALPSVAVHHGAISWWAICALSIVNPSAEEFVYNGFLVNVLRRRGELSAIAPAVAARLAIHVYQGPLAVFGIGASAVVFGVYYYRTRRLWPVVVAHGLIDLLGLAQINAGHG